MQAESLHGTRSREWVAPNLFRRKKDGTVVFDVIFRDADDRQRQRRLDAKTERAARREARAILAARDGGERIVAADLTLDQVAERDYFPLLDGLVAAGRRAERGRDRYVYDYRRYVSPTLGSLRLGEIEPRHLADLIRFMRVEGFSEASIYNALLPVRAIYRLARRRGLTSRSPFDGLDPAELPRPNPGGSGRVLDEVELAALVRHATDGYRPVLTVLAYSGLRVSEVLGLTWADVDFVEGELRVRRQLLPARQDRPARLVPLKTKASERDVPLFPPSRTPSPTCCRPTSHAAVAATTTSSSRPAPADPSRSGTSPAPSRTRRQQLGSPERPRATSGAASARWPGAEGLTRWRRRRSPDTRPPSGHASTRARSARRSGTRPGGGCLSTASAPPEPESAGILLAFRL
jgi:integrase